MDYPPPLALPSFFSPTDYGSRAITITRVRMYICIYVRMYVCIYVCMYVSLFFAFLLAYISDFAKILHVHWVPLPCHAGQIFNRLLQN